jgi:hypothetical protein
MEKFQVNISNCNLEKFYFGEIKKNDKLKEKRKIKWKSGMSKIVGKCPKLTKVIVKCRLMLHILKCQIPKMSNVTLVMSKFLISKCLLSKCPM